MPYIDFPIAAGIVKDDTPLAAEGRWVDADKVRFQQGRAQTVGGWELATPTALDGIARGGHAYATLAGDAILGVGTNRRLYSYFGGTLYDATPLKGLGAIANAFNVAPNATTITVSHSAHGLTAGDIVKYSGASEIGGRIDPNTEFSVASVIDANSYTIVSSLSASTSTSSGGGTAVYEYLLSPGNADGLGSAGYGTGAYGSGTYGSPSSVDVAARTWSLDNWGEFLVAAPRGGDIYEWTPDVGTASKVTNGDFSLSTAWTYGASWSHSVSIVQATTTNAALSQSLSLRPSYYYRLQFRVPTLSAGTLLPSIGGTAIGGTVSATGTYVRVFQAPGSLSQTLAFTGTGFTGTLDDISVVAERRAQRITNAPRAVDAIYVTPQRQLCALKEQSVYYSDIENNQTWTASASNLAGVDPLAQGGRLVRGLVSRGANLIWSNAGLIAQQFLGDPEAVFAFTALGTNCGLIGPNAATVVNGVAFWMAPNGNFYRFAGGAPEIIPCPDRRYVFDDLAPVQNEKIYCGANAAFGEVWWFYPAATDGNECSRYVVYNFLENHWTVGTFARTTWVDQGVLTFPMAVDTSGMLYFHERGTSANGGSLVSSLRSSYFDIAEGDNVWIVRQLMPDFDDQQGDVSVTLRSRNWSNGSETTAGPNTLTTGTLKSDFRIRGRQISIQFDASAAGSFWRLGQVRIEAQQSDARR